MGIKKFSTFLGIITVLLLSYWSWQPIFIQGFFPMHDDTQVSRVFEMGKVLKEGIFPVRWVPDLGYGYGYPIFNFYAPLAYYIGGFFNFFGFDALFSTKMMMGLGVVLSSVTMFFLAKEFFGKIGGITSSLFYVYAPYHAVQIYVRGAVAEYFAYAFIPLVFLGLYKVFCVSGFSKHGRFRHRFIKILPWMILGSVGYAGVILSHNLTVLMVTPFLLVFIITLSTISYQKRNQFTIYYLLFTLLLGITLSAFYWIPAILEVKYTNVSSQVGGGADFREHFVCFSQLWDSPWGFGGSNSGCVDGLSFKIGKLHFLIVLFSFLFFLGRLMNIKLFSSHYSDSERLLIILFSILGFLGSLFFMIEISKPVWKAFSFMAFIQYPWRFLVLSSFFSSLLAGSFINVIEIIPLKKERIIIGKVLFSVFLISILLFTSIRIFRPQTIYQTRSSDFTNEKTLKWTASKISDEYMPKNFKKPSSEKQIVYTALSQNSQNIIISNLEEKSTNLSATIKVMRPASIVLNKAHFPGWALFVQDNKENLEKRSDGYLLRVLPGVWSIYLTFQQTEIEKISNALSLIGTGGVLIGIIYWLRNKKQSSYEKTES